MPRTKKSANELHAASSCREVNTCMWSANCTHRPCDTISEFANSIAHAAWRVVQHTAKRVAQRVAWRQTKRSRANVSQSTACWRSAAARSVDQIRERLFEISCDPISISTRRLAETQSQPGIQTGIWPETFRLKVQGLHETNFIAKTFSCLSFCRSWREAIGLRASAHISKSKIRRELFLIRPLVERALCYYNVVVVPLLESHCHPDGGLAVFAFYQVLIISTHTFWYKTFGNICWQTKTCKGRGFSIGPRSRRAAFANGGVQFWQTFYRKSFRWTDSAEILRFKILQVARTKNILSCKKKGTQSLASNSVYRK